MERERFKTLLNNDHKFRGNEFVEGKILGFAEVICDLDGGTKEIVTKNGKTKKVHVYHGGYYSNRNRGTKWLITKCTKKQYEKFRKLVESKYPGLCTFYCEN